MLMVSNPNRNRMRQSTTCDYLPDMLNYWARQVTDVILLKVGGARIDEVSNPIRSKCEHEYCRQKLHQSVEHVGRHTRFDICCQNKPIHVPAVHSEEPNKHTPDRFRNMVGLLRTNVITTYGVKYRIRIADIDKVHSNDCWINCQHSTAAIRYLYLSRYIIRSAYRDGMWLSITYGHHVQMANTRNMPVNLALRVPSVLSDMYLWL